MKKKIGRYFSNINELINFLQTEKFVFIQPHNFPDHDAVASAFGLQHFLKHFGLTSYIVYETQIQRDSLKKLIKELNIEISHISQYKMKKKDRIILVDGCKGYKNVTDLIGDEVAVIDHHKVELRYDVEFSDIRTNYGACSSIIVSYFTDHGVIMDSNVASALMTGILMDTNFLRRNVSEHDLNAYIQCYKYADFKLVQSILRNYITKKDLNYYKFLIENLQYHNNLAFCYFPDGCNQNLLGILADFVLSLEEVNLVVLCAKNDNNINFSVRSEIQEFDASLLIKSVLKNIGFGGGHSDMAGGIIKNISVFDVDLIYDRILSYINH